MKINIKDYIKQQQFKYIQVLNSKYNLEVNENALFKAIFLDDMELMQLLYNCGMDFQEKINNTYPLHFASFRGNITIFKFIYTILKDIDLKSLSTAILNNKIEVVDFILSELDKGNIELDLNSYIDEHFTLLSLSIMVNNINITKKLLKYGIDVNKVEKKRGDSPLMLAVNIGNVELVKTLLENNANPNFIAKDGFTPLIVASYLGNVEVVKVLLEYDSNIHYKTEEGVDALNISLSNNKLEVADFIEKTLNN